ncbi:MAG: hypothetical protein IKP58_02050, partial [Victivallales bacterium]|nr:hypothetical protein [Victivallales bacterium]
SQELRVDCGDPDKASAGFVEGYTNNGNYDSILADKLGQYYKKAADGKWKVKKQYQFRVDGLDTAEHDRTGGHITQRYVVGVKKIPQMNNNGQIVVHYEGFVGVETVSHEDCNHGTGE